MADDGPLIREDGRPSAKEMLRSARANEKLRATHAAELLPRAKPRGRLRLLVRRERKIHLGHVTAERPRARAPVACKI